MRSSNRTFCTILLLIVFSSCGTSLKCCRTIDEVKELLSGCWKEVNSERKSLDKYSFSDNKGYYEELESINDKEYLVVDDHMVFEVINENRYFKIKFTNLLETWVSDIKYLDKEKLVLVKRGKEKEYYRFNK